MLFHTFDMINGRDDMSEFAEMQVCALKTNDIRRLVSSGNIRFRREDSLYFHWDDNGIFLEEYGDIFICGIYNDLKSGVPDFCGINYYRPEHIDAIISQISEKKPPEHEMLLRWLDNAKGYNGFYILGI